MTRTPGYLRVQKRVVNSVKVLKIIDKVTATLPDEFNFSKEHLFLVLITYAWTRVVQEI